MSLSRSAGGRYPYAWLFALAIAAFTPGICLAQSGTIIGRVVKDINGNGQKDGNEPYIQAPGVSCGGEAISGFAVTWSGRAVGSAGLVQCVEGQPSYHSGTLPAGTYFMGLSVPSGWQITRTTVSTVVIPGNSGDPWFYVQPPPASGHIIGRVVKDINGNGQRDAGEPYIQAPGVSCGGEAISGFTVTWSGQASGSAGLVQCVEGQPSYHSGTLSAGTYFMGLSMPNGWQITRTTVSTVVIPGNSGDPWFYVQPPSASGHIIGRVVKDINGNGQRDAGEPYIQAPGANCGGEAVSGFTVTWSGQAAGSAALVQCVEGQPSYHSGTLSAGTYFMGLSVPSGWQITRTTVSTVVIPGNSGDPWFYVQPPAVSDTVTISSIDPATPTSSPIDQDVVVRGVGFQNNLSVLVGLPGGGQETLSGAGQILNVTPTSFTLRIKLADYGPYKLRVINPSGASSNEFGFLARSAPAITLVTPQNLRASSLNQDVRIEGYQFQLKLKVIVTFPGGGQGELLPPGQILDVTQSAFKARILFRDAGTYKLQVVNPDFGTSALFSVSVDQPSCQPPRITSQPLGLVRAPTESVSLNVAASGTAPLTYTWYAGTDIVGTGKSLTVPPANISRTFVAFVKNACGTVSSDQATVSLTEDPREAILAAFRDFRQATLDGMAADLDAYALMQGILYRSNDAGILEMLETAWSAVETGWSILRYDIFGAVLGVADLFSFFGTQLAQNLTALRHSIPLSADTDRKVGDAIEQSLIRHYRFEFQGANISLGRFQELTEARETALHAIVPNPLPPTYPVAGMLGFLRGQTSALDATKTRGTTVLNCPGMVCQQVWLGNLQQYPDVMKGLTNISDANSDASLTLTASGLLLTALGFKKGAQDMVLGLSLSRDLVPALQTGTTVLGFNMDGATALVSRAASQQFMRDIDLRARIFYATSVMVGRGNVGQSVSDNRFSTIRVTDALVAGEFASTVGLSLVAPDIVLTSRQPAAQGTVRLSVSNPGAAPLAIDVSGIVTTIVDGDLRTVGLVAPQTTTVGAGTNTIDVPLAFQLSDTAAEYHYDVQLIVGLSNGSEPTVLRGPFVTPVKVGTAEELQTTSGDIVRELQVGDHGADSAEHQVQFSGTAALGLIRLAFRDGSDFDLHVYDEQGRHAGRGANGLPENQIPGARYSGLDAQPEWFTIENPGTQTFRVVVVPVDAAGGSWIDLTTFDRPARPAVLLSPPTLRTGIARTDSLAAGEDVLHVNVTHVGNSGSIEGLTATLSALTDAAGHTLPQGTFTVVSPGSLANGARDVARLVVTAPFAVQSGTFQGALTISGNLHGVTLQSTTTIILDVNPSSATYTRYLAEGAIGQFFDTRIALLNPTDTPGTATLSFMQPQGDVVTKTMVLGARTRATVLPRELQELTSDQFSTRVDATFPVVVDRTVSWGDGRYGSHAETSVVSPSSTWYFAEGSTSGEFALFYLLQNPNVQEVTATIRYLRPFGLTPVDRTYTLPGGSRTTIPVDSEGDELASTDVSAVVTATRPIIAERAMYRSRPGQVFAAGSDSTGATAPALRWLLAEGATGTFFDNFVLLANPNAVEAQAQIDYLLDDGRTLTKTYAVPAFGRVTVWVDDEQIPQDSGLKPLRDVVVSCIVTSTNDVPLVVERTMWWPGPETATAYWMETHNAFGTTETGTRWALADGELGGPEQSATYILIANTSPQGGQARVTLFFEDGTSATRTFDLLPRSRMTVDLYGSFPEAHERRFGSVIESLGTTPAELIVERAMYTSPGGQFWAAGTNALATRLP